MTFPATLLSGWGQKKTDRGIEVVNQSRPDLADSMEDIILEGLTVFSFPGKHRRRLLTSNGLERLNSEIRRRTRVAILFSNTASCLRW